jgi:hypothetical protein
MGEPEYLSQEMVARLAAASELVRKQQRFISRDSIVSFELTLPPHGVAAVEFEFRNHRGMIPA